MKTRQKRSPMAGLEPTLAYTTPASAVGSPGGTVGLVTGSAPTFAVEIERLLRSRLRAVAICMAGATAVYMVMSLTLGGSERPLVLALQTAALLGFKRITTVRGRADPLRLTLSDCTRQMENATVRRNEINSNQEHSTYVASVAGTRYVRAVTSWRERRGLNDGAWTGQKITGARPCAACSLARDSAAPDGARLDPQ